MVTLTVNLMRICGQCLLFLETLRAQGQGQKLPSNMYREQRSHELRKLKGVIRYVRMSSLTFLVCIRLHRVFKIYSLRVPFQASPTKITLTEVEVAGFPYSMCTQIST